MANFGALWVGKPLSKLEQTSLSSFIHHGHSLVLYVYDMKMSVPEGVIKRNARDIIPKNKIFMVDNSYGPFADMFRYRMIQETGLIWTDTDNICLTPNWQINDYVFGRQGGGHGLVAIGVLAMPKNSKLLLKIIEESSSFDKDKIIWGEIGPQLLTKYISEFKLGRYIKEPEVFYPIDYWDWEQVWDKRFLKSILKKCRNSYTLQVWNQMRNRAGVDPNNLPEGSAIEYFYNTYYKGDSED